MIYRFQKEGECLFMSERSFALDIGTQSVTGIVLQKQNNSYEVLDYDVKLHKDRAMLDGQIHDVQKVANVIKSVADTLAMKHGELSRVRVAAAGRALKTVQAEASLSLHKRPITDKEMIRFLELQAVQNAQEDITEKGQSYYCVGYSILHYKLDDEPIGSLIDQMGDKATVEVIATFLPQVVVESLLASLERADLTMEALTLEPIAAIHVLIPDSMRRLNIALVDIGAGTSDVAITKDGTVIAYGMVDQAGDEITEAISDKYLLDFTEAEQAKKEIVEKGSTTIDNILGISETLTAADLFDAIRERVQELASRIADEILSLNGKTPQAVMLIGGGSLTPGLGDFLRKKLQLPENRLAIRTVEALRDIENVSMLPDRPDFITPLGIAITSLQQPITYTSVTINGRNVRLFEGKELTIGDAFIHAGISVRDMYGTPGLAYIITYNGEQLTLPGELGQAPTILKNGKEATIDDVIADGDELTFKKGKDGANPNLSLKELIDDARPLTITVNQEQHTFYPQYIVNGDEKDGHYMIQDRDEIVIRFPETVRDVLSQLDIYEADVKYPVYVDGKIVHIEKGETKYTINGEYAQLSSRLQENDQLLITYAEQPVVQDVIEQIGENILEKRVVTFNGEKVTLTKERLRIQKNGEDVTPTAQVLPKDKITLQVKKNISFIFQDVFRFVDIDRKQIKGHYKIYLNDVEATFFDEIKDGDRLELK